MTLYTRYTQHICVIIRKTYLLLTTQKMLSNKCSDVNMNSIFVLENDLSFGKDMKQTSCQFSCCKRSLQLEGKVEILLEMIQRDNACYVVEGENSLGRDMMQQDGTIEELQTNLKEMRTNFEEESTTNQMLRERIETVEKEVM